ncbi:MAG: TonB-dependent receptor [Hyphomonadaceae bacterium]|nr:TonB-dependent receptor [Hyphomonadaceae bacterium]
MFSKNKRAGATVAKYLTGAAAVAISMATVPSAYAQETTSAVRGSVSAETGESIPDAQVIVRHGPTGSVSSEASDAGGVFDLRGLRVGGPYTIEVTADGYEGQRLENVFLEVGQPFRYDFALQASDAEIVVTATGGRSAATGSNTLLTRDDIAGAVSITRDIRDLARRDPLVTQNSRGDGGISIAGSNPRTNRVTIDGVQAQDDFGLNTGGLPTRRGPISLDAVRQFAVEAAPFDVENGDFIGGAINIVLREGDNDFSGSAFINYLNDELVGTRIFGQQVDNTITQENWGATFRGPILQDRLFFALSYETYESLDPTAFGPAGLGFSSTITGPNLTPMTQAEIDAVTDVFATTYGSSFNAGSIALTKPITDEKYTGRFDWNINEDHLASLTVRHSESGVIQRTNLGSTSAGLDSQWYLTGEDDNTMALQVNSSWTDQFTTEFRVSQRDYTRLQEPPSGQAFADISVCSVPGANTAGTNPLQNCRNGSQGVAVVRFGPDQFRHANYLETQGTQAQFSGEYQWGAHLFKAGVQWQNTDVFNIFLPNSDGTYYFDSISDFSAGDASQLVYRNAISGVATDAAAVFDYDIYSALVQDTWDLTDRLTLAYGFRYDTYSVGDQPAENPNFAARYAGRTNQETYDGRDVLMPRFSFTYDPTEDIRVSGGVGLFSGGLPDVFLSNVFSNTGIIDNTLTFQRLTAASGTSVADPGGYGFLIETSGAVACNNAAPVYGGFTGVQVCSAALNVPVNSSFGTSIPAAVQAALGGTTASPTSETNVIDPNFEIPSVWKANVSLRWDLLDNLRAGLDLFGFQDQEGLAFRDIRAQQLVVNGNQALTPDGRIRYDGLSTAQHALPGLTVTSSNPGSNRDIEAYNPGESPFSWIASLSLSANWENGVEAGVSYTRQDVTEYSASARFSSTASSLYGGQWASYDPNTAVEGRGQEEITDSFKYNFGWRHNFVDELETRFTLFGEWRTGRPLSFTMNGGTGRNSVFGVNRGSQLAYVPDLSDLSAVNCATGVSSVSFTGCIASDPLVVFDAASTITNLQGMIDRFDIPTGGIVARGSTDNPDIHRLDLQISQQLPGLRNGHRTMLTFDIANVLNLLNDEWGVVREYGESLNLYNVACAGVDGVADNDGTVTCDRYRISGAANQATITPGRNTEASRWAIQVGLRYEF